MFWDRTPQCHGTHRQDCETLGSAVVTTRVPVPPLPSYDEDEDEDEDERDDDDKVQFHNKIISIIGFEEGLGVESLQGAGKIAAETSIANRVRRRDPNARAPHRTERRERSAYASVALVVLA